MKKWKKKDEQMQLYRYDPSPRNNMKKIFSADGQTIVKIWKDSLVKLKITILYAIIT